MSYRNTKFWKKLVNIKNAHLMKKHYVNALKMNPCNYEDYLCNRYEEIMNRQSYTFGSKLNLENPTTFTEKCQWIKLYDQDPRKPILSDKYLVREYVKNEIGSEYLVPIITIDGKDHFYDANEINFKKLPNSFVLKCNHGSHMNIIVKDKSSLTKKTIKKYKNKLNKWLKTDYVFYVSLETQYKSIKPCIIVEQLLEPYKEMLDFKFMFFHGQLQFYWINEFVYDDSLRTSSTFLPDGSRAPFNFDLGRNRPIQNNYSHSRKLSTMQDLAKKLASNFTMVRVDFMSINNKIYFSELTFNSAAGYDAPRPIEFNKIIGDRLLIDKTKRDKIESYRKK